MVLKDRHGLTLTICCIFGRGRNRQVGYPDLPKWMPIKRFAARIVVEDATEGDR